MGLLDDLLGAATGNAQLGAPGRSGSAPAPGTRREGAGRSALMALLPIVLAMLAQRGRTQGRQGGGGLGDILGQVLGGRSGATGGTGGLGDILGQVMGGSAGPAGGLGDLLQRFERHGHGDTARSWVATGPNPPIEPDAIKQVFGAEGVGSIARQAGLSENETAAGLAQLLPAVIDHVTPQGQAPEGDELDGKLQELLQRFIA